MSELNEPIDPEEQARVTARVLAELGLPAEGEPPTAEAVEGRPPSRQVRRAQTRRAAKAVVCSVDKARVLNDQEKFCLALYDGLGDSVEVRHVRFDNRGAASKFVRLADPAWLQKLCDLIAKSDARGDGNTYVGMATRRGGGKKENCRRALVLWADVDRGTTLDALINDIMFAGLPEPSFVSRTSFVRAPDPKVPAEARLAKFHVEWLLREPFDLTRPGAIGEFESILRGIALLVDGDRNVVDASRILRPPGTTNRPTPEKIAAGQQVARVEMVLHRGERHSIAAFDEAKQKGAAPTRSGSVKASDAAEFDPGEKPAKLVALLESNPSFAKQYARDVDNEDDSDVDFAIMCRVYETTGDAELAELTARHSRWEQLGDDKALKRDDYWPRTRAAAVAKVDAERAANRVKFEEAVPPSVAVERKPPLEELNERFVVVPEGSDTFVYELVDGKRGGWKRRKVGAFKALLANRFIEVPTGRGGSRVEPIAEHWFTWGGRRTAVGVGCFPEGAPPNWLNTWMGWAVKPDASGKWPHIAELIEVLANRDPAVVRYILDWCANMIQRPGSPGEVALVFVSEQGGTGKNTFLSKVLGAIAGLHSVELSSSVARNFNAHLRDAVYLHCVEAFWAGDHRATAMLKNMITEGGLFFEPKGVDGAMAPNMLHIALSSNADWVFPAHLDERRFMASRVSEEKVGDKLFWHALNDEIENGGLSGFLAHLLDRDIRDRHPRQNVPQTTALIEQKLESLSPIEALWLEWLRAGVVPASQFDAEPRTSWESGPIRVAAVDLQAALRARIGRGPAADRAAATAIGRMLRRLCPSARKERSGSGRGYVYVVPEVTEARAAFEKAIGGAVKLDW